MQQGSGMLVVDADGHVCEPADLWERELPASMRDRGIRLRWNEQWRRYVGSWPSARRNAEKWHNVRLRSLRLIAKGC